MTTGLDAKKMIKSEARVNTGEVLEIWTCGCTAVGSITPINIRCIQCGNDFKKVGKKSNMSVPKKVKNEGVRFELVNNIQTLYAEGVEEALCQRCGDLGEIKVYTQEWDMIKSHMSPCPDCHSQEWLDWSTGRRLVGNDL